MSSPTIVWFRQDLRLGDNPALAHAAGLGPVVPVFVWYPEEEGPWAPGGASRWWLDRSLRSLDESLRKLGSRLVVRQGDSLATLRELIAETGASRVVCSRRYEPAARERDEQVEQALWDDGVEVETFNASLLNEPTEIENKQGKPFQVFTAYWKTCLKRPVEPPLPAPKRLKPPAEWPAGVEIDELGLAPTIDWDAGLEETWSVGEGAAMKRLRGFCSGPIAGYKEGRDMMAEDGVSMLSPHLHFGEIGPRQVWAAAQEAVDDEPDAAGGVECFLSEIGWREFAYHLLWHFPATPEEPLRESFARFPWNRDDDALARWQRGQTGYPIVDAAMRQLWHTGWMHNRARMIVASFLTKDLLIPWQDGAAWFWDTLVDADLASNTLGWQWTAGCGADAAPYFRVFNPVSQAAKFDPDGDYIRRWVPELAGLDVPHIFDPPEPPPGYPAPMVDHAEARKAALAAYDKIRAKK